MTQKISSIGAFFVAELNLPVTTVTKLLPKFGNSKNGDRMRDKGVKNICVTNVTNIFVFIFNFSFLALSAGKFLKKAENFYIYSFYSKKW